MDPRVVVWEPPRGRPLTGHQVQTDHADLQVTLARVRSDRLRPAVGFGAVVLVLVGLYYLPAIDPSVRTWAYPVLGVLSACAVLVGVAVHRPAHPGPGS